MVWAEAVDEELVVGGDGADGAMFELVSAPDGEVGLEIGEVWELEGDGIPETGEAVELVMETEVVVCRFWHQCPRIPDNCRKNPYRCSQAGRPPTHIFRAETPKPLRDLLRTLRLRRRRLYIARTHTIVKWVRIILAIVIVAQTLCLLRLCQTVE